MIEIKTLANGLTRTGRREGMQIPRALDQVRRVHVDGRARGDDTPENFEATVVPALKAAIAIAERAAIFVAGTQAWSLPRPSAVGGVYLPAGNGRCSWGFQNLAHCIFYGSCPDLHLGAKHIVLRSTEGAEPSEHPCPKPIGWMLWAVNIASRKAETVLDPFMGSGTTLVAAVRLGRKGIGIEKDPGYFAIARKRIEEELDKRDGQGPLMRAQERLL